jgi:hypothetical protein
MYKAINEQPFAIKPTFLIIYKCKRAILPSNFEASDNWKKTIILDKKLDIN